MTSFTFDAEAHEYRLAGLVLPSVTQIIAPLTDYSGIPADVMEFARARGQAVHLACELDDKKDLDESTLDPQLLGYLTAWRAFARDFKPRWGTIEEPIYSEKYGIAGTPDRTGQIAGKSVIVEIKATAKLMNTTGPQLSGYDIIGEERYGVAADERYGVQLRADGTYRYKIFENERATFLACRSYYFGYRAVTNWKAKHGQ